MCTAKILKSPTCSHWWAEILTPCGEGKNIGTCASFENGRARLFTDHPQYKAKDHTCPRCDKKDDYDPAKIRMVKELLYGGKIGSGPNKSDFGFEMPGYRARQTEYGFEPPNYERVFCCAVM